MRNGRWAGGVMVRIKVVLLGLVLLGGLVAGVLSTSTQKVYATAASAAGEWTSTTMPEPADYSMGSLGRVSCSSATFCQAVGTYVDTSNKQHGFIESYDGTSWTLPSLTDPAGTYDSQLSRVACVSSTFCVATGSYRDINSNNDTRGLLYTFDGTSWTSSTSPQPGPNVYVYLSDIDCVSTAFCQIVGAYQSNMQVVTHTLAMTYDGTSWSLGSISDPAGATSSYLQGVDCVSSTFCQAVGGYRDGSNKAHTTTQGYDGTSWTVLASPDPLPDYDNVGMSKIHCVSTTFCQAVGEDIEPGFVYRVITKSFDGSAWTVASVANQTGFDNAIVSGMECASTTACQAAGSYQDSNGDSHLYLQAYDSTGWKIGVLAEPAGSIGAGIAALSCASASFCQALGNYSIAGPTSHGLGENYNGTEWDLGTGLEPTGFQYVGVADMDCVTVTSCQAVGSYTDQNNIMHIMAGSFTLAAVTPSVTPLPASTGTQTLLTKVAKAAKTFVAQTDANDTAELAKDSVSENAQPTPPSQNEVTATIVKTTSDVTTRIGWWFIGIAGAIVLVIATRLLIGKRNTTHLKS